MHCPDWRPSDALRHLREAREAATTPASVEVIRAAVTTAVTLLDRLEAVEAEASGTEHAFDSETRELQRQACERLTWAAEHVARREQNANSDLPF
jgi:hypothetical protein